MMSIMQLSIQFYRDDQIVALSAVCYIHGCMHYLSHRTAYSRNVNWHYILMCGWISVNMNNQLSRTLSAYVLRWIFSYMHDWDRQCRNKHKQKDRQCTGSWIHIGRVPVGVDVWAWNDISMACAANWLVIPWSPEIRTYTDFDYRGFGDFRFHEVSGFQWRFPKISTKVYEISRSDRPLGTVKSSRSMHHTVVVGYTVKSSCNSTTRGCYGIQSQVLP